MTASPAAKTPRPVAPRRQGGVATLTLQSPASRNALSLAMIEALSTAFARIGADGKVRVVVLAGEGPALSAGHDLKELRPIATTPIAARLSTSALCRAAPS